jgi:outer membrane protein OmpA-like peptidoglycan-associated protein
MNAIPLPDRARLLVAVFCIRILLPVAIASAQTMPADGPLPPPAAAPESRLTVTPAKFEQWLAGISPANDTEIAEDREDAPPSLVTPPPPTLVTPPPPPTLVTPPPPPTIAPAPATAAVPTTTSSPGTAPVPTTTPVPETTPAPATAPAAPPAEPEPQVAVPTPAPVPPPPPPATSTPDASPQPAQPMLTAPPAPQLAAPEEPRVATLPPDSPDTTSPAPAPESLARPDVVKILYPEGEMELPDAAKADLAKMADWLRRNPAVRVQIVGYASETSKAGNQARRTSLFRTLAVRKYLVENGVLSIRMNVRALGANTDELPRDRVEISLPPS